MVNLDVQNYEEIKFLVEHLSDPAPSSKLVTGISQRIHDRRRAYYEDQRRQLFAILEKIGRESEDFICGTIKTLHTAIESSETLLEFYLTEFDPRISQIDLTLLKFHHASAEIERNFADRRGRITKAEVDLETKEKGRKEAISEAFETFLPKMMGNSHLIASDVSLIIEQEFLLANQIILRNRRAYASLFERLMVEAVVKEKQSREKLKLNQAEWKELKLEQALQVARERLETCCCLGSEEVAAVIRNVLENQKPLLMTLVVIMNELDAMIPPGVSVEKCRKWLEQAEEMTRDLYEATLEGLEQIRQLGDALHLRFFDNVFITSKALQLDLDYPKEDIQWKFQERCLQLSAEKQAQLESDLQWYTLEVNRQKDNNVALLHHLFAFMHGAVWHWQLQLTSLAKAEEFMDLQLQKQRTFIHQQIEAKAAKLRTILEALRHSGSATAINTQLHAAANVATDIDHQLKESLKKTQRLFTLYPSLISILSRGYKQRLCAYLQVSLEQPTVTFSQAISENLPTSTTLSHYAFPPYSFVSTLVLDHPEKPEGSRWNLPDILIEDEEKVLLDELGLTSVDIEELSLRLKSLPEFQDDPRRPPPTSVLYTKNGISLYPCPASLQDCFRFISAKEPLSITLNQNELTFDLNAAFVAETESQIEMTTDLAFDLPKKFGLIDLSSLINALPDFEREKSIISDVQKHLTLSFLTHAVDEWDTTVSRSSQSLMESKKEIFELEIQTRLRCLNLRSSEFIDVIAKKRRKELVEHEEQFKVVETAVMATISYVKQVEIARINKLINEHLLLTKDNLILLENGFSNATRQSQVDHIKKLMKEEMNRYVNYIKNLLVDFRINVNLKCQKMQQEVRDASSLIKKFADGGNYNLDELKHYQPIFMKFIDKLTFTEKSAMEEARLIEMKRRTVIEIFFNKVTEKVLNHEADIEIVQTLTGFLAKTQNAIKKEAALANFLYSDVEEKFRLISTTVGLLKRDVTSAKFDPEKLFFILFEILQKIGTSCGWLECLVPHWTINSPSDSPSTKSITRNFQLTSPPQSPINATESTLFPTSTPTSKIQSTRKSSGFQSSGFQSALRKQSKTDKLTEIPTDFQLTTVDGPVPLVVPRTFAPFDQKTCGVPSSISGTSISVRGVTASSRGSISTSSANAEQKRKQKQVERFFVFGEIPLADPKTFLENVHVICWQALNNGLAFAEEYHRVRGSRAITRPALIPDSFEMIAEKLCKKLLNHLTQSEHFASVLMEKFRKFSSEVVDMTVELATLLFHRFFELYRKELTLKKRLISDDFLNQKTKVCDLRQDVDDIIKRSMLLCKNDVDGMLLEISKKITNEWSDHLHILTVEFLRKLNNATEKLFKVCDQILLPDEQRSSQTPPIAHSRLSTTISPFDDIHRSDQGHIWKAFLLDDIDGILPEEVDAKDVQCSRTTMAHLGVEDARHRVYAEFLSVYQEAKSFVKSFEITKRKLSDNVDQTEFVRNQMKRLIVLDKMI